MDPANESTETISKGKRTRKGENFASPIDVNLHSNDFEWTELLDELSDEDRELYSSFVEQCNSRLKDVQRESAEGCLDCFEKLGHGAKLESTEGGNWEKHYSTNKQHFPVKNYVIHAFPKLLPTIEGKSSSEVLQELCLHETTLSSERRLIMEAGCGTGSVTLPLLRLFPRDKFVCFDVSETAIDCLQHHPAAAEHVKNNLLRVFSFDMASSGHALTERIGEVDNLIKSKSFDIILLVFVLSAMPSIEHMVHILRQLRSFLKPETGVLCFRDYGALDHNFFRFHRQKNELGTSLTFKKGDGTEQFFFDLDFTRELFKLSGLVPTQQLDKSEELFFHCNRLVNRKNGKRMDKVFVNGTFKAL